MSSSSALAVGVSLIGLSLGVFTVAIFIQMILSFPAMLSSNSRTYVQQRRQTYHIPPTTTTGQQYHDQDDDEEEDDDEDDNLDEWVGRWLDEVDAESTAAAAAAHHEAKAAASDRKQTMQQRRSSQHATRGRTLRRQRRGLTVRTVLRV